MSIKAKPTEGLSYNPSEERYWDKTGLDAEIERTFDVCHGCRLCFNLCPTFPLLFGSVDRHDGDVRNLTHAETEAVVDSCYQCKLCYVKCPYTADDGHEFLIDVPRLLLRYTAQRARREGVGRREKLLANPVALGKLASNMAGAANWANRTRFHRVIMERMVGIHRDKLLPEFHRETFESWLAGRSRSDAGFVRDAASAPSSAVRPDRIGVTQPVALRRDGEQAAPGYSSAAPADRSDDTQAAATQGDDGADLAQTRTAATVNEAAKRQPQDEEVVLFHTCFVNYNNPALGRDAVMVLERNGIRVLSPVQTCCGMPALDGGDVDFARAQARRNVESLAPYAERGIKILAINPTCSYTLKKEYPELVGKDMEQRARRVAESTRDLMEFVFELKRQGRLLRDFKTTPGEVAYHVPCHLKAQNIGFRSRDAMKLIPGAKVRTVERCCGHDGTWAMKTEHFEESMRVGRPAFEEMSAGGRMVTDCPLAALQFEQATGTRPIHPVQVLARAYEADGFDEAVPAPEAPESPKPE